MLQKGDLKGLREVIPKMEHAGFVNDWISYYEARLLIGEKQWLKAERKLDRMLPGLSRRRDLANLSNQVNFLLADCYQHLGQPDREGEAANRMLSADPNSIPALVHLAESKRAVGKMDEAKDIQRRIREITGEQSDDPADSVLSDGQLQMMIADQLQLPKEKRDWTKVDQAVDAVLATEQYSDVQKTSLKTAVLLVREAVSKLCKWRRRL